MAHPNLHCALALARAGLPIFPCNPNAADEKVFKTPLGVTGWKEESTSDPDQIARWWQRHPSAMPAIDVGKARLLVLDGDVPKHDGQADGVAELNNILAEHGVERSVEVDTVRQGFHVYFRQNGAAIGCPHCLKAKHNIDVKGIGGYVIAPGAVDSLGRSYSLRPHSLDLGEAFRSDSIPYAPEWLETLLAERPPDPRPEPRTAPPPADRERKYAMAALLGIADAVSSEPEGNRNCRLFASAARIGNMVASGWLPQATAWATLREAGITCGLVTRAVERTLRSAFDAGLQTPHPALEDRPRETPEPLIKEEKDPFAIPPREPGTQTDPPADGLPLVRTLAQFLSTRRPPSYIVDGILQRGYLYTLTAPTGHGKTAVSLYLNQALARGKSFGRCALDQCSVLYLAGENPPDLQDRWLGLAATLGFDPSRIAVWMIDGVVSLAERYHEIADAAAQIPNLGLVTIDTSAAYNPSEDDNSNMAMLAYARLLRQYTTLPGNPTVLACAHPVKNPIRSNLLPRGGGAFLNEVDGNLTLWAEENRQTELHWQGKFRGPEFEPMMFALEEKRSEAVTDIKGRQMPFVVARAMSDTEQERNSVQRETEENILLAIIGQSPKASLADLARKASWFTPKGEPAKARAQRHVARLLDEKLIVRSRGKLRLTSAGKAEIGWED